MSSKKLGLSVVTIATGQKLQRDFNFFFLKIDHLWSFNAFSKKLKQKGKFLDKLGQTICSFFHVLAQFLFSTSVVKLIFITRK